MRDGGGIEVRVADALAWIDHETGVGAARVHPEFDDFAVAVEELIELHFTKVLDAEVVGSVGIFATEGEPRASYGLERGAFNGRAVGVQDLDA